MIILKIDYSNTAIKNGKTEPSLIPKYLNLIKDLIIYYQKVWKGNSILKIAVWMW